MTNDATSAPSIAAWPRWAWNMARLGSLALVLLTAGLFLLAVPLRLNLLTTIAPSADSGRSGLEMLSQLHPQEETLLRQVGLSVGFYAGYRLVLEILLALATMAIAILLFARKPNDPMALFTALMIAMAGLGSRTTLDVLFDRPVFGLLPDFIVAVNYTLNLVILFNFPDGRFVPRWTAGLAWLRAAWEQAFFVFFKQAAFNPYNWSLALGGVLDLSWYLVGLGAQIYRYRNIASPAQRQQTKWVITGMAWAIGLGILAYYLPVFFPPIFEPGLPFLVYVFAAPLMLFLSSVILPVAITVAILRFRLWDIDFTINRSLVYGGLLIFLGGVFTGLTLGLRAGWQALAGSDGLLPAIFLAATLTLALFPVLRRPLQRFVDRRFYHIEIDYQARPAPAAPRLAPEAALALLRQTHFSAYQNLEQIGQGGMASVFRSQHPDLQQPVAIKLLHPHLAADPDRRQRFLREAQIVSQLDHHHIVRVFDYGEVAGAQYIVMEYLPGGDLKQHLLAHGRLPLADARLILRHLADALDYIHARRLVHRDIKPANIMLTGADGIRVVLTDFGIAKLQDGALPAESLLTPTGEGVVGTFDYIAPEQIQALPDVDGRADIYALGVMAYQMLTGELPFKHSNPGALLIAHLSQPAPDPRALALDLPWQAAAALQQALAKEPDERFETAGAFVNALG